MEELRELPIDVPLGGYLRISDVDVADLRRAVKAGLITEEEAAFQERKAIIKQKEDLRFLAQKHGRSVVWYEDHRLSAFKRTTKRPDFARMRKDLTKGAISGVISYDIDRFSRQPRELESYIDVYEDFATRKKIRLIFDTLSGQNFDLSTSDGRFSARLFVSIANKSSEDTSRRIKRDNTYRAKQGNYHGGTLSFGWKEDDQNSLDPKWARLVAESADDYLKGDKVSTIMQRFHDEGAVNPNTGKPFTWAGVKTILFRARNAGIRIHLGEPLYEEDGSYVMGRWEPIFGVTKYEALLGAKKQRAKSKERNQGRNIIVWDDKSQVKYLLSRIVRCGNCGFPMVGKPVWVRGKKTGSFAYNCNKQHPDQCGKMGVTGPRVDALIKALIWQYAEKAVKAGRDVPVPSSWTPEKEAQLKDIQEQLDELQEAWNAKPRKIKAITYVTTKDELEAEKEDLRAERAFSAPASVRSITPELLREGWDGLSIERQRRIIRHTLKAVIIHPSSGGKGGTFDPRRVEPVFN